MTDAMKPIRQACQRMGGAQGWRVRIDGLREPDASTCTRLSGQRRARSSQFRRWQDSLRLMHRSPICAFRAWDFQAQIGYTNS